MKEYTSPTIEFITFDDTGIISASYTIDKTTTEEEVVPCEEW